MVRSSLRKGCVLLKQRAFCLGGWAVLRKCLPELFASHIQLNCRGDSHGHGVLTIQRVHSWGKKSTVWWHCQSVVTERKCR